MTNLQEELSLSKLLPVLRLDFVYDYAPIVLNIHSALLPKIIEHPDLTDIIINNLKNSWNKRVKPDYEMKQIDKIVEEYAKGTEIRQLAEILLEIIETAERGSDSLIFCLAINLDPNSH